MDDPLQTAFLFDLDGTLVDSVYQHALAWHEALSSEGIELSMWRIHRRIGMSGATGLDYNVLYRKLDRLNLTDDEYDEIERDVAIMEAEALDAIHTEK